LPSARDGAVRTCLIVTSAKGLAASFDKPGIDRIVELLRELSACRRRAGIETLLYFPDSSDLSGDLPQLESPLSAHALHDAIGSIESGLHSGAPFDYVFIVGGSGVVPFWRIENPAGDSDGPFSSDAPYGAVEQPSDTEAYMVPDRGVGRLPLGHVSCLELLVSPPVAPRGQPYGVSAAVWKDQAARVFGLLGGGQLDTAPPLTIDTFESERLASGAVLYFNVHGSKDGRSWYGQDGLSYPRVLSPESVARADPMGSLVFSEACYGGLVEGRRPENSIALQFVTKGVGAFVGATATAYGSPDERLTEADLLAYLFLKRVLTGETYGDAFREAKTDFAAEMLRRQGYLDGDDKKTLVEFDLYGDPTLSLARGASGRGRGEMISDDIMDSVKRLVATRFPEMAGVEPDLAEEKGVTDGVLAKKVMRRRPASAVKGEETAGKSREKAVKPEAGGKDEICRVERRVFVASFKRVVAIGDRNIERIVRITFDSCGEVLKIVTSK
jgi:hypothetical protein